MKIELHLLQHVIALARHRHYGRAAEALSMSQSALSRSIGQLEAQLGAKLFDRGRGGVRPTLVGDLVIAKGQLLVDAAGALEREVNDLQGVEFEQLRVGCGLYPAEISVATALGQLSAKRPELRISLIAEQWRAVTDAVLAGEIDVAVVELSLLAGDSRVHVEHLDPHVGAFVCRAGHPLASVAAPDLAAILAYPLVGPRMPPRLGQLFAQVSAYPFAVSDQGDFLPPFHVESYSTGSTIVKAGNGVAPVPRLLVEADIASGALVAVDFSAPWLRTNYGFAYPSDRPPSAAVLTFIEEVRGVEASRNRTFEAGSAATVPAAQRLAARG